VDLVIDQFGCGVKALRRALFLPALLFRLTRRVRSAGACDLAAAANLPAVNRARILPHVIIAIQ
jgi:hypothetical protein